MPTNGQFAVGELVTASDANTLFTRGYRNRIINGNFEINQRGYVSGTNLASGSYGFDRWKSGFTNTALTFTDGIQATTITISSSGVLQQIIERENMPAGTYTLSWTGTATGRIYNFGATAPAYAAGPITVTLDGSANVVVEFTASGSTKTLGLVQVEAGTVYSPFEYRHRGEELALCQRYYQRNSAVGASGTIAKMLPLGYQVSTTASIYPVVFSPIMRATPTINSAGVEASDDITYATVIFTMTIQQANAQLATVVITYGASGAQFRPQIIRASLNNTGFIDFSAEL